MIISFDDCSFFNSFRGLRFFFFGLFCYIAKWSSKYWLWRDLHLTPLSLSPFHFRSAPLFLDSGIWGGAKIKIQTAAVKGIIAQCGHCPILLFQLICANIGCCSWPQVLVLPNGQPCAMQRK